MATDLKSLVFCYPLVDKLGITIEDFKVLCKNWLRVSEWVGLGFPENRSQTVNDAKILSSFSQLYFLLQTHGFQ